MKEITYRIPDESTALVSELVEKLGGISVEKKKTATKKAKPKKKNAKKKQVSPTFLFGKWKNFDIDPRKLRDELWRREF
jgi:hypothetical protein